MKILLQSINKISPYKYCQNSQLSQYYMTINAPYIINSICPIFSYFIISDFENVLENCWRLKIPGDLDGTRVLPESIHSCSYHLFRGLPTWDHFTLNALSEHCLKSSQWHCKIKISGKMFVLPSTGTKFETYKFLCCKLPVWVMGLFLTFPCTGEITLWCPNFNQLSY